jgi:hypothetical protein
VLQREVPGNELDDLVIPAMAIEDEEAAESTFYK